MADKSNNISKKTIIAIVSVIVLLFIAGLSVGIFLADKGSTEAVDGNQTSSEAQVGKENKTKEDKVINEDKSIDEDKVINEDKSIDGDKSTDEDKITENNDQTVESNTNNVTTTNDNININNNNTNNTNRISSTEITTSTNVNQVGETTITRVEEKEKLISREFWDWWTPADAIAADSAVARNIIPKIPDFSVEKSAETGIGENKLVYAGKNITYAIRVTNNGEQDLKNIEITDRIPEQTTFESIEEDNQNVNILRENDIVIGIKWLVTVPAKESIEVKFTVKVDENATGIITNAAIVNGKESNEEKTAIINAKKSSKIIERNDVEVKEGFEIAKLGDKIKYTITVTNTGDISGKTTVEDTIPVGTELIESSVTDEGKITTIKDSRKQISWNVELNANNTIERTFIVEVKDISGKIENVATIGGVPTNTDRRETANINVEKIIADIKRDKESIGKDAKVQAGDAIEYIITVTNTGSADLTNVVLEEKLEYVTIESLTINGELKTITKNNEGKLVIGDLKAASDKNEADKAEIKVRYIVNYEKDIQGNVGKIIHNEAVGTGETIPTEPDKIPETVSDKDEKDVSVDEVKALTINKIATKIKVKDSKEFVDAQNIKVRPGDIVEYIITITNTGNTILENITVTDSLKVTVNNEEKEIDPSTGISTIAVIPSLSAVSGENTTTIITYYTVTKEDVIDANPIKNVAKATVPDGPTKESHEEVPVNPDKSVLIKKIWEDSSNKYGTRPSSVEFTVNGNSYTLTSEKDENIEENSTDIWTMKVNLPKYNANGNEISYNAIENTIPPGYTKISEEGTTIINRANEIVEKKAYKADDNGNIKNEVTNADKFKSNEIVYYKLIIKNPGNVTVATKTLTDTLPLRLRLLSVAETNILRYPQNGTDNNKDAWSVVKETDSRAKINWTVSNLAAGETRELVIKAQVITESEYKDICKETGNESTDLKSINNEVFMDNEKKDEVSIDLEEIKITGKITIKEVNSSTEEVNTPMDVVFVLDTSGSMAYNLNDTSDSRAKAMVNAVNNSAKIIMSKNAESRIGVIGFSGDSSTIIPLGKYAQNTDYLKYITENQGGYGRPQQGDPKIGSNVGNGSERTIKGGTNTQSGIKAGAKMLIDAQNKTYKITINNKKVDVTRTPVLILVTDGEPTYYYENEKATGKREGSGGSTDENYYYWTIRTAKYYKDQITKTYYPNEEDNSKVFTIGIGMSGYEATALLDPNETNVKACDTNGYDYERNQAGKLYDLLNKNGTPYAYDYADGTESGALTEKNIEDFLIKSIVQSSENTIEERSVTLEESTNRIIKLNKLDETKKFVLIIGEKTYNSIDSAKNAGYLKGNSTNGYYLDFTRADVSLNISLTYFQKK